MSSPPLLTVGPVRSQLRAIAVPMTLGFVALNSYSIVDTYFVGQLGTLPLAAMSFTFPVTFAMISIGLGIGIGTSSVVALLLGKGERDAVQRIVTHALMLGAVFGLIISIIGLATIESTFQLLGADDRTLPLITDYMQIYYFGSIFLILPMIGNFAIRATGDAMVPAIILVLSAMLNIILDPLLIFGLLGFPRLELQGAAIASVVSNCVTFIAAIIVLYRGERLILPGFFRFSGIWNSWQRLLHISIPVTATNLLVPITMGVITALVASFGPEAVAGFGVASRIESVVFIMIFALQSSVGPFVGQNYGSRQFHRVKSAVSFSINFCIAYSLVAAAILFVVSRPMAGFFDDDPIVLDVATTYLRIVPFSYAGFSVMMIAVAVFNALARPMPAAVLTFLKFFIVYLPLAWGLSILFGLNGVFWANALAHVVFGVVSYVWLRRFLNHIEGVVPSGVEQEDKAGGVFY